MPATGTGCQSQCQTVPVVRSITGITGTIMITVAGTVTATGMIMVTMIAWKWQRPELDLNISTAIVQARPA